MRTIPGLACVSFGLWVLCLSCCSAKAPGRSLAASGEFSTTGHTSAQVVGASIFELAESELILVGNVTVSETTQGNIQYTEYRTEEVSVSTSFGWQPSHAVTEAACLSVSAQASAPIYMMIFDFEVYNDWKEALDTGSKIDATNTDAAVAWYSNITDLPRTTHTLDPAQIYLFVMFNPHNYTVEMNYSLSALTADAPECEAYELLNATSSHSPATTATSGEVSSVPLVAGFAGLDPGSAYPWTAYTGATCLAFGVSPRAPPDQYGNIFNFNADLSAPVANVAPGLNLTVFLLNSTGFQAAAQNELQTILSYKAGPSCTITEDSTGPCIAMADGLDPSTTYQLWLAQGDVAASIEYYALIKAGGAVNGSCDGLLGQPEAPAPGPLQALPAGPPPPAIVSQSSSSSIGAIAGGVAGGLVALAILAGLIAVYTGVWRPCSKPSKKDQPSRRGPAGSILSRGRRNTLSTDSRAGSEGITTSFVQDFERALSIGRNGSTSSEGIEAVLSSSELQATSSSASQTANFSDLEHHIGINSAVLPSASALPSEEGLRAVGTSEGSDQESLESSLGVNVYLDSTWKIHPRDLQCKMHNGKPVLLGSGGFGAVYLGLLNGVRDVAVKVVTSENPEQQMRFIREIAILKSCRDPNIVQFLGASVLRQQTFMVMQFMEGGDLYSKLAEDDSGNYLWHRKGQHIALDVAKGVCFLHSKNIAHLDLKSPNVLLTKTDEAKIGDVGLGKLIHGADTTATQMGTFMWASPEQLMGGAASTASDIYSMGSLLWEICTGQRPAGRLLRPIEVPQEAPQAIVDLIHACHDFEPSARPTAVQVHNVIKACME